MHISPLAHGMIKGHAKNMAEAAKDGYARAEEAWCEAFKLKNKLNDAVNDRNAIKAHYVAKQAENEYLMDLLDDVYGEENNPAREKVYKEDTKLRIPCGDREGEIPGARDHVFYVAMKDRYENSKSLPEIAGNWFEVIRKIGIF